MEAAPPTGGAVVLPSASFTAVVGTALPIVLRSMRPRWLKWSFWCEVGARSAAMTVRAG